MAVCSQQQGNIIVHFLVIKNNLKSWEYLLKYLHKPTCQEHSGCLDSPSSNYLSLGKIMALPRGLSMALNISLIKEETRRHGGLSSDSAPIYSIFL